MSEHTKVPWRVDPEIPTDIQDMDGDVEITSTSAGYSSGPYRTQKANARFIVMSANNHAALVEALTELVTPSADPIDLRKAQALLAKVSQEAGE